MDEDIKNTVVRQKCPRCGDNLAFDPMSQKMVCASCGSSYDAASIGDDSGLITDLKNYSDDEADMYHCPSCGGDLIHDKGEISLKCPYCDSNLVLTNRISGLRRPNKIIPFKIDKDESVEFVRSYLLNSGMSTKNMARCSVSKVNGMYIPFWTYSSRVYGYGKFERSRKGAVTEMPETVYKIGSAVYQSMPVDSSKKTPNELTESIEPFDFTEAVDFESRYMFGYTAEKFDDGPKECFYRAKQRMSNDLQSILESDFGDDKHIKTVLMETRFPTTIVQYVLCPIWIIDMTYNGSKYRYYVNGQTGRVSGYVPVNNTSVRKISFVSFLILQLIPILICALVPGTGGLAAAIVIEILLFSGLIYCLYRFRDIHGTYVQMGAQFYLRPDSVEILHTGDMPAGLIVRYD